MYGKSIEDGGGKQLNRKDSDETLKTETVTLRDSKVIDDDG